MANMQGVIAPASLPYVLIWGGSGGRLTCDAQYWTGITGHEVTFARSVVANGRAAWASCVLHADGRLIVRQGTEWDFGSGAVDTPAVVIASLAHDIICHLTNARLLPWSCRAQGDAMYREMLRQNGASAVRRSAHWLGVRAYSELIARWRDKT